MNQLFAAFSNPLVRKILPVLGEIANEFGVDEQTSDIDGIIKMVRSAIPVISSLRKIPAQSVSTSDLNSVLKTVGIAMSDADLELWVAEIQKFASNADESLQQFLFGPSGRKMLTSVLIPQQPVALAAPGVVPVYDPVSGIFHFD